MRNRNPQSGLAKDAFGKVLPEGFDLDYVAEFFATGRPSQPTLEASLPKASQDGDPAAPVRAHDGEDGHDPADFHSHPNARGHGLDHANDMTEIDLNLRAQPMKEPGGSEDTILDIGGAGAKPADRGNTSGDDGGGSEKGGGRNKKIADPVDATDPAVDESTDTNGSTDTGTAGETETPTTSPTTGSDPSPETQPSPVPADYVSGLDTPDGFNVSVSFVGGWTESMIQGFVQGVEMISDVIIGDLPDVNGIDDIHITASLTSIDGSGGYWGWGGTTASRSGTLLPSSGYIKLDEADIGAMESYGLIDDFVFHEILHAMGFGTSWSAMGLVETINGSLRFIGENAIQAYNENYANIASNDPLSAYGVPVEMEGGSGTAGVHWDDATFGEEVMTGQLNFSNDISDITIAALQDMGYETIYGDEFVFV